MLDEAGTAHLHLLAQAPARRRRSRPREDRVAADVAGLIDTWDTTPAFVQGRYADVLAVNALAGAVSPVLAVGTNLLRAFLDPRVKDMHPQWDELTRDMVAAPRATLGPDTDADDPRVNELIGQLSIRSEQFGTLWARHDVQPKRPDLTIIEHPQVGRLEVQCQRFPIPDTDGQELVTFFAERGSRTAQSFALLASMPASTPPTPTLVASGVDESPDG